MQNFAFKFQAVAERTANIVRGLLYFAAPCILRHPGMFKILGTKRSQVGLTMILWPEAHRYVSQSK